MLMVASIKRFRKYKPSGNKEYIKTSGNKEDTLLIKVLLNKKAW